MSDTTTNEQLLSVIDAIEKSVKTLASMCETMLAYTQSIRSLTVALETPDPSAIRESIMANIETMGQRDDDD